MASTSARLKRMAADCSMAARVWERSPCSRSVERLHGRRVDGDRRDDRALARHSTGAMPDTQTPKSSAFRTLASRLSPASTRASFVFGQPRVAAMGDLVLGLAGVQDGDALVADHREARDEAHRRVAVAEPAQRGRPSLVLGARLVGAAAQQGVGGRVDQLRGLLGQPGDARPPAPQALQAPQTKAATISGSNCVPAQRRSSARH